MPQKDKDYVQKTFTHDGKRYYALGKTEEEAIEKRTQMKEKLKRGEILINSSMTVTAWSKQYLETYAKPRVRAPGETKYDRNNSITEKSYKMYEQQLKNHIVPAIGHIKLKDVKDTHLQRLLNQQAGKSQSHATKMKIVIQQLFHRAYRSRLILFDPAEDIVLPATTCGERRSLTEKERKALIKVAESHRCGLWIETLLMTGIRPGESAPLIKNDFDLKNNILHITKAMESGSYVVSDPKTSAGIRDVPIPKILSEKLTTVLADKQPFDLVFPQTDGKRMMTTTCISNNWRSFKRQMDIALGANVGKRNHIEKSVIAEDLVLYCLRHTYCTDLQAAGVPINIAKYLMGHSDISTTANIYTHANEKIIKIAADKINGDKNTKQRKKQNSSPKNNHEQTA